jgi:hypothetical protein
MITDAVEQSMSQFVLFKFKISYWFVSSVWSYEIRYPYIHTGFVIIIYRKQVYTYDYTIHPVYTNKKTKYTYIHRETYNTGILITELILRYYDNGKIWQINFIKILLKFYLIILFLFNGI